MNNNYALYKPKEFKELQHELEQLDLGELIEILEQEQKKSPGRVVKLGIGEPHSWRGDYSELAFEPKKDVTIDKIVSDAKAARNSEFCGYKGGYYKMTENTYVYLDYWGESMGVPMCLYVLKKLGVIT